MALPDTLLARLIETVHDHGLSGSFAMLGRQRWIGTRKGKSAKLFKDVREKYLPGLSEEDLHNADDQYSEVFFEKLGFSSVDSIDISDFEGASVVIDMSKPVDPATVPKFDVLYDGGTTEHIFDLPTAWRNLHTMLKPGGVLIGHSPCNNWINHGFFQVCPEAVFGFWESAMGYEVLELRLQPLLPNMADRDTTTTNPNITGVRPRIKDELPKNSPLLILYAVRKPATADDASGDVYQSDYKVKWTAD